MQAIATMVYWPRHHAAVHPVSFLHLATVSDRVFCEWCLYGDYDAYSLERCVDFWAEIKIYPGFSCSPYLARVPQSSSRSASFR